MKNILLYHDSIHIIRSPSPLITTSPTPYSTHSRAIQIPTIIFKYTNIDFFFLQYNIAYLQFSHIIGTFTEQQSGEICFREISTPILEKVIQYFYYKVKYTNSTSEIPEFPIDPEIALELLMAANFLDT